MDPNESPETCSLRELREETGYVGELVDDQSVSHGKLSSSAGHADLCSND